MKIVLIVDDDIYIREALTEILLDEGFEVRTANDGSEGIAQLRAEPTPFVVLLDLMMPRTNGFEFRDLQRQDPALAGVPVIVMSADFHIEANKKKLQAADYLEKPLNVSKLISLIRNFLSTEET